MTRQGTARCRARRREHARAPTGADSGAEWAKKAGTLAALLLALELTLPAPIRAEEPQPDLGTAPEAQAVETRAGPPSCGGEVCGLRTAAVLPPACVLAAGLSAGSPAPCGSAGAVALFVDGMARPVSLLDGRGCTRCQGTRVPSIGCCPLWRDVAVVDAGAGPLLVASYGLGIQVRDAGGIRAAAPVIRDVADGVESCTHGTPGDPTTVPPIPPLAPTSRWLAFPIHCLGTSEQLNFVQGVDAVALPGGGALLAAAAATPAGLSLWRLSSAGALSAVYQRGDGESADAVLFQHGARLYALFTGGLRAHLVDATAALSRTSPACERCDAAGGPRVPGTATSAPGVYLGQLPVGRDTRFAAVLSRGGRTYVALTALTGSRPGIWELRAGPGGVLDPALTVRRLGPFSSMPSSRGVAWIPGTTQLLAVTGGELVARDWGPCLTGGCTSPPVSWSFPLPQVPVSSAERTLDLSCDELRCLAYAGVLGIGEPGGKRQDGLIEIVGGAPTRDLLGGGGVYRDPCSGVDVDFYGWSNPKNANGRNNYQPHRLLCRGSFCYIAAEGELLTYQLPPPLPNERIFADGFASGDTSKWSQTVGGPP